MYDVESVKKLIRKAIRGNLDAYGKLMMEYQSYLYKMAYLYVRNQDDALDIVGETVLKGFENVKSVKKPEYFKTWITRILINTAIDYRKRNYKYTAADNLNCGNITAELSSEIKYDLQNAIAKLPDKYRIPVILKYYSGMSIEEISEILNIPANTVGTNLHRARRELKMILKEDYIYEK